MIIVGIDFYGTITKNPRIFRKLATALLQASCSVHIVTAVKMENVNKVRDDVKKSKVPYTSLEIVTFKTFDEIPQLKLARCKMLGIKLMFEDIPQVAELLEQHGILAVKV